MEQRYSKLTAVRLWARQDRAPALERRRRGVFSSTRWSQTFRLPGRGALSLPGSRQDLGAVCPWGRELSEVPLADELLRAGQAMLSQRPRSRPGTRVTF